MLTITALTPPESLSRTRETGRTPLRVGLVQHRWHENEQDLRAELDEGIAEAAGLGARVVFLPELTLSRYPAFVEGGDNPGRQAEDLLTGPTFTFAAKAAAEHGVLVHASLYERNDSANGDDYEDGLGFTHAPSSCTSRSPPATPRTPTSGAVPRPTRTPSTPPQRSAASSSGCRRAGTN